MWLNIAIGAACGGLAAFLARAMVGTAGGHKGKFALLAALLFAILYVGSTRVVLPGLTGSRMARTLAEEQPYTAIKQYDKAAWEALSKQLDEYERQGRTPDEVKVMLRGTVEALLERKLPDASDEATVKYVGITMDEMEALQQRSGELCYQFVFPQPGSFTPITPYIPQSLARADVEAFAEVIRTASTAPNPVHLTEGQLAKGPIPQVMQTLQGSYGNDIALLQNPAAATTPAARQKVCAMTISLYREILKQPVNVSGPLLRTMMAGK